MTVSPPASSLCSILAAVCLIAAVGGTLPGEKESSRQHLSNQAHRIRIAGRMVTGSGRREIRHMAVCAGGAESNAMVALDISPEALGDELRKVQAAFEKTAPVTNALSGGFRVRLWIEWENRAGETVSLRAEETVHAVLRKTPLPLTEWCLTETAVRSHPEVKAGVNAMSLDRTEPGVLLVPERAEWSVTRWTFRPRYDVLEAEQKIATDRKNREQAEAQRARLPPPGTSVILVIDAENPFQRFHAWVSGHVQGVGFRAFTAHHARLLHVRGWVKNLRDGRVELLVEGPAFALERLFRLVEQGPPASRVDNVKRVEEPYRGDLGPFRVEP